MQLPPIGFNSCNPITPTLPYGVVQELNRKGFKSIPEGFPDDLKGYIEYAQNELLVNKPMFFKVMTAYYAIVFPALSECNKTNLDKLRTYRSDIIITMLDSETGRPPYTMILIPKGDYE